MSDLDSAWRCVLFSSVVVLACAVLPLHCHASSEPNIILILADDLGYGDVSCFNAQSRISTPHIDRLAAEGMRFTDAHSPGAVCVPTRYGLMTGRYPFRHNLKSNPKIDPNRMTIATLLQRNGFSTAMVGKWHLGFKRPVDGGWMQPMRGGPVDRGFQSYFGIPSSLDIPPYLFIRGRQAVAAPDDSIDASHTAGWSPVQGAFWRAGGIAPGFRHEDVLPKLEQEAVDFIERHARSGNKSRLFLYVALTAPHTPWVPVTEFRGSSPVDLYGAFVTQVDATVGQILQALDEAHMTSESLVIVTSDNGPVWFPDDVARFGHRSAGPFRGMKGDAWEGGHRMPFVARWPGHVPENSTCGQTICFTDLMATFAAIVGDVPPEETRSDSFSILPLLLGQKPASPIREITIHKRDARTIRRGPWKLITHRGSGGMSDRFKPESLDKGPPGQLYHLEDDPAETNNLWEARPDIVEQLRQALHSFLATGDE